MDRDGITNALVSRINELQEFYKINENINQKTLDSHCVELKKHKEILRPNESDEIFAIVDEFGRLLNITAPRWFCHLIGLRHRCVHILLEWTDSRLGDVLIFQVRSWDKSDSPGHLDISVGGHVVGDSQSISVQTAYKEMEEELGITKSDLKGNKLTFKKGYEFVEKREKDYFFNLEWRDVYLASLNRGGMEKINFNDKEVVGLYLCPKSEAFRILYQNFIPIASALKNSLKFCLNE